jgi:tetratricopeptide (TPR) repeat protein
VSRSEWDMTIDLGIANALPSQSQLTQMIQLTQKHVGKIVRVEWKTDQDVYRFFLGAEIKANSGSSVPEWTLRRLSEVDFSAVSQHMRGEDVVFRIVTGDVGLLLNLIWSECTGTNQEIDPTLQHDKTFDETFDPVTSSYMRTAKGEPSSTYSGLTTLDTGSFAKFGQPVSAPVSLEEQDSLPNTVMLSGDLSEVELPGVLQSIKICNMVGRLDIRDGLSQVELFFVDGEVVHAAFNNAIINEADNQARIGDSVVLDVLTWHRGNFFFKKSSRTSERSIKRRLEGLLLEAACLRDYSHYTTNAGANEETVLELTRKLTDSEAQDIFEKGVNVDLGKQMLFYKAIDGKSSIGDIAHSLGIAKTILLPILFNVLSYELAAPLGRNKVTAAIATTSSLTISSESVARAARKLVHPETGICDAPMFMHFLELEHARYIRKQSLFSIVLFEFKIQEEAASTAALQQMSHCFDSIKEKYDLLGQLGDCDFALLIPLCNALESTKLVDSFAAKLVQTEIDGLSCMQDLHLAFGVADVVDAESPLSQLLQEAEAAKLMAIKKRVTCRTFGQSGWEDLKEEAAAVDAGDHIARKALWSSALIEARRLGNKEGQLEITLEALADVCMKLADFVTAEQCLVELLKLKKEIFGGGDESVLKSGDLLVKCYSRQGKYSEAEDCIVKVVREYLQIKGTNNSEAPDVVYTLVAFYRDWKQIPKAIATCKHVLNMNIAIFGADDLRTARAQEHYDELRSLSAAEEAINLAQLPRNQFQL